MKTILTWLFTTAVLINPGRLLAQATYTLNWNSGFSSAWVDGATSGTANNIGGSGVNCTVSITRTGGLFSKPFGSGQPGPVTPSVNGNAYVGVGGSANSMLLGVDFSTNTQSATFTFTFNALVPGVRFNISDIDRLTPASRSYLDRVVVVGSNGVSNVNPTITRYTSAAPTFLVISGNTVNVNPVDGIADNAYSTVSDQRGTVIVDFGLSPVSTFSITYSNVAGTQANPGVQNVAIGNIQFATGTVLPVTLTAWKAAARDHAVALQWSADQEADLLYYAIERSRDGIRFGEIGRLRPQGGAASYAFRDENLAAGTYQYRLKMTGLDGQTTYSKTATATIGGSALRFTVYPTLFRQQLQLTLFENRVAAELWITDMKGQQFYSKKLAAEDQQLTIATGHLPAGTYLVTLVQDGTRNSQFVIRQ